MASYIFFPTSLIFLYELMKTYYFFEDVDQTYRLLFQITRVRASFGRSFNNFSTTGDYKYTDKLIPVLWIKETMDNYIIAELTFITLILFSTTYINSLHFDSNFPVKYNYKVVINTQSVVLITEITIIFP